MRKFKFRAWLKNENKMAKVHSIHLNKKKVMVTYRTRYGASGNCSIDDGDFILQQYTGFKDKNGVEIYEGDLLTQRSFKTIYLVDFNNENCGHVMGWNLLDYGYFKDGIFSECEKVEYSNSNTVNYPVSEYYYGKCPTNNEIDGLDPYYEVVGNIFEGVNFSKEKI